MKYKKFGQHVISVEDIKFVTTSDNYVAIAYKGDSETYHFETDSREMARKAVAEITKELKA